MVSGQKGRQSGPNGQQRFVLHPGGQDLPLPHSQRALAFPRQGAAKKAFQNRTGTVTEILVCKGLEQQFFIRCRIALQGQKCFDFCPVAPGLVQPWGSGPAKTGDFSLPYLVPLAQLFLMPGISGQRFGNDLPGHMKGAAELLLPGPGIEAIFEPKLRKGFCR